MELEAHTVDRYMQLVKRCFTMTNVMLKGGRGNRILHTKKVREAMKAPANTVK